LQTSNNNTTPVFKIAHTSDRFLQMKIFFYTMFWLFLLVRANAEPLIFDGGKAITPSDLAGGYKGGDISYSTNKEFGVQVFESNDQEASDFVVVLCDGKDPARKTVIYQGAGKITAGWSDDGKVLFVNEQPRAGESYISLGRPDRDKLLVLVDWIYSTSRVKPGRKNDRVNNCKWKIVRWNTAHGTVTLECEWNYTSGSSNYRQQFDIPVAYEPVPEWQLSSKKGQGE
jgi:hypothetical protein